MNNLFAKILRHKTFRAFWQLLSFIITLPLYYLGYLIPKDSSLWIFGNYFGFKDNARYLYEYVLQFHPEINPVWICIQGKLQSTGGHNYSCLSFAGIWYQYRAAIAFVSTGQGDLARFTLARTKIVQLWHGIPIKHILLDSPETLPFKNKDSFLYYVSKKLFQKNLNRYSIVIASSKAIQHRMISAFGLPEQKISITGYPRNDIIYENSNIIKKQILYAPTWRDNISDAYTIIQAICNQKFISEITKSGYVLLVSIHPLNKQLEELLEPVSNIIQFTQDQDINYTLAQSEILITDYSSIAIDFAPLNRKIIFYTPDMEKYFHGRGIYKEFETIIKMHGVTDCAEVLTEISTKTNSRFILPDTFFHYNDAGSRKRIVEMVKKLLPANPNR